MEANAREDALKLLKDADRALAGVYVSGEDVMQMAAARMMLKQLHGMISVFSSPAEREIPPAAKEENTSCAGVEIAAPSRGEGR